MQLENEYNNAVEEMIALSKLDCSSIEQWAEVVTTMYVLAMAMHNIVNLERFYLLEEVAILRARLDAESSIGRISGGAN